MANKNLIGITIDPGHSWNYNRGVLKDYYESNKMYDLSLYLTDELNKFGIFKVYNTKSALKTNPSLYTRGNMAIQNNSRVFISLHSNAFSKESAHGTVTFYSLFRKDNKEFAIQLSNSIVSTLKDSGVYDAYTRTWSEQKSSSGKDYYGVIRNSVAENGVQYSCLIEHAFHTNKQECIALNDQNVLKKIAVSLAKTIYDNMKKYYVSDTVFSYNGVAKANVNVRVGNSVYTQLLGTISKGTNIRVVAKNGSWYKIIYNGAAAYISSQYIDVKDVAKVLEEDRIIFPLPNTINPSEDDNVVEKYQIDTKASVNIGTVTCSVLNIRKGPSTSSPIVEQITAGSIKDIYTTGVDIGNWYCVKNRNDFCFGSKDYIKVPEDDFKAFAVTTTALNYRDAPGITHPVTHNKTKVIGTIRKDTIVYATPSTEDGWMQIKFEKDRNAPIYYVSAKYLLRVATKPEDCHYFDTSSPVGYGRVDCSALNVRAGAGTGYKKIGSLKRNEFVIIYAVSGDWYQILYKNLKAYAHRDYILELVSIGQVFYDSVENTDVHSIPEGDCDDWFLGTLNARVSSGYGYRTHPVTGAVNSFHSGIDYAAVGGTKIYTPIDGMCITSEYNSSCGNMVILLATDGTKHYFYHMQKPSGMQVGKFYLAGTCVGVVGTTGNSTGNHLHYEIRVSPYTRQTNNIDPKKYVYKHTLNRMY